MKSAVTTIGVEKYRGRWFVYTESPGGKNPANIPIGQKFHKEHVDGFGSKKEAELQAGNLGQVVGLEHKDRKHATKKEKSIEEVVKKINILKAQSGQ